jgi:hypothetical protein
MISKFKDSSYLTALFASGLPYLISYLLGWIAIASVRYYLELTIKFDLDSFWFSTVFTCINVLFYYALIARHKSLHFVKRKSGWLIFFNHIKVFFTMYLLMAIYFKSLFLTQWVVWWPGVIFPLGYLTLVTGVFRYLVKSQMGKWYPGVIKK